MQTLKPLSGFRAEGFRARSLALAAPTKLARVAGRRASISHAAYSSYSSYSSMDDFDLPMRNPNEFWVGGMIDYYAVLEIDDDATTSDIKKAYRSLAKVCHPDFLGEEGHDICILLNEAYQVLSDVPAREKYNAKLEQAIKDNEDEYTGKPLSKWIPTVRPSMAKNVDPAESRAVFVDEFTCIGCKQCVWQASATFRMEPEHGRSRVYAQWLDDEEHIQGAIDSCPVSCIHWVDKNQLAPLEYVMQKRMTQRTNVGVMMSGSGVSLDVWSATESFLKERKRKEEAMAAAAKQRNYSPQQEQARRAATSALRKKTLGMFAQFGDIMDNLAQQMAATVGGVPEELVKVGKRKRAARWAAAVQAARAQAGKDYYLVPPERALVLTSKSADDATYVKK